MIRAHVIRALIFDYGGVFMRTMDPRPRRELEQRLGLPPGGASRLVFGSPMWEEAQLGRVTSADFWASVGQQLGLETACHSERSEESHPREVLIPHVGEGLAEFQRAFWAGDRLDEELMALIRHLRAEGYCIALLSNNPAEWRQHVEELDIADAFDVIVVSGCEGVMKPGLEIFARTLERLGVPAQAAVFVDDFRENVDAARQVGLHAVRFQGLAPLRAQLRDLGVIVPDPVLDPLQDIRAVVFDWGDVIEVLPDDAAIAKWEERLSLVPGTLPWILWGELWRPLAVGAITNDEYAERIAPRLGLPDAGAASRFIQEFYAANQFNWETVTAVRALRGRYKVALLTNAAPGQDAWARERFGLDVHAEFDVYVNSAYVGLSKPDPAIFQLTLDRLGVAPQQAILVDDNLRNVDAARQLGLHAVQFVDPATSFPELEALLGHSIK